MDFDNDFMTDFNCGDMDYWALRAKGCEICIKDNYLLTFFYLVSFIPGQCKGNICAGVLDVREDLDASHIFFPHIETMGGIVDTGSGFLKFGDGASIKDIYEAGFITYKETESKFD